MAEDRPRWLGQGRAPGRAEPPSPKPKASVPVPASPRTPSAKGTLAPAAPRPGEGERPSGLAWLWALWAWLRRAALGSRVVPGDPERAPDKGEPAALSLGVRIAEAYLGVMGLAYLELYGVGFIYQKHFIGKFEMGLALHSLVPLVQFTAAPAAVVFGALVELARKSARWPARIATTLLAAAAAAVLGYGLAGGRHFEGGLRIPFAIGLGVAGAAMAFVLAPRLARVLVPARTPRRGAVFLGVAVALIVALEVANARILPRLYPAFHLGLGAMALFVAAAAGLGLGALDTPPPPASGPLRRVVTGRLLRAIGAAVVFSFGAARASAAAERISKADNIRVLYHDKAPLVSHVLELAARLSPPVPIDDEPAPAAAPAGRSIDLAERDLLLITVDALRADHVGAYGYARKTTPNLDKLAQGGVVFDAAYSPTPHTSYAVTSLMTGKYMRPLVLQGLGEDSETWAGHLRRYGYKTAAFYPPAIFFIDGERFTGFKDRGLDFEYRRVEFAPATDRAKSLEGYLASAPKDGRVFAWVHLFEPHEPYENHPEHPFGDRDVDRYDSEIAAADEGIGAVVEVMRKARPNAVVIVTADHGEEFGEHGGRFHGTTVYEEQVRVPLVVEAPGLFAPRRVAAPVQLVDLLPTVLSGLDIPRPARVRGNDLGPWLAGKEPPAPVAPGVTLPGFAFSETETMTMLARGPLRLVCVRKIGACSLYDVERDPAETADVSEAKKGSVPALKAELRAIEASHGRYERQGLRSEGKGWPEALRRAIAGDGDAASDVAALLDDADVVIRRKAAETLFELGRPEVAAALRLAQGRDEDDEVRRWTALAITRLGQGAPRVREMLNDPDPRFRRLAALALAESGDPRGEEILVRWLTEAYPRKPEPTLENPDPKPPVPIPIPFERAREVVLALGKIKAKQALLPLLGALSDLRLRPFAAKALRDLGEEAARPALAEALRGERSPPARGALAEALVKLGGGPELRAPLVRFLGTPDPLPDGLKLGMDAGILELIGGPRDKDMSRLRRFARSGVAVGMIIPKVGDGVHYEPLWGRRDGLRAICRAKSTDRRAGEIRLGLRLGPPPAKLDRSSYVPAKVPPLDPAKTALLPVPALDAATEVFATMPAAVALKAGEWGDFVVYATQNVEVSACAVVPLYDELPPPAPEAWKP